MNDSIETTVDYRAVCVAVEELAGKGQRRLIETLADDIADLVLEDPAAKRVKVELRKFILPQTEWVAVVVEKEAG